MMLMDIIVSNHFFLYLFILNILFLGTLLGEVLDQRYHVYGQLGKGVFSSVLLAHDTANNNMKVAIKVIRNNDTM
jgi:serine/threonine protein kinase